MLKEVYHALVPLAVRRHLRLTRFSAPRRARARLWRRTDGRVAVGPLRGFRLAGDVPDDCFGAALLGAYECETHEWLEREVARGWPAVVNIGSSEGYYSVGLARRMPASTVHAYEMDDALRVIGDEAARRNGVANVVSHAAADPAGLAALGLTSALVVSDCEGAERELMDPIAVPWLQHSALLVELHDVPAPGIENLLRQRFSATHDIEVVTQGLRDPADWARAANISVADARILLEEQRPQDGVHVDSSWMLLTPRAAAAPVHTR